MWIMCVSITIVNNFFSNCAIVPSGPGPHYRGFTMTLIHTKLGRTPLDEWSVRRRDLYLTHNTHKRQTSMPSAGFEPTNPACKRPQTHALDRAVTGIGYCKCNELYSVKITATKYSTDRDTHVRSVSILDTLIGISALNGHILYLIRFSDSNKKPNKWRLGLTKTWLSAHKGCTLKERGGVEVDTFSWISDFGS
jgi:hypothetical protein